jgi:hypothetical protein
VKSRQQGHEKEDSRDPRAKRAAGLELQFATVRDFGRFGARLVLSRAGPGWTSASVREKKGGVTPWRQSPRNRHAIDLSAEGL